MKLFRKILFWVHLVIGLAAGGVIAVVAFTGATMAFEKQVIAWAERDLRRVSPPAPDAPRLPLEKIITQLRASHPDARPGSVVISSDPSVPLTFSLGRTGSLYVDPYTGEVKPSGAKEARAFFRLMLTWHRWLGVGAAQGQDRPEGRPERDGAGQRPGAMRGAEGEDHDHGPAGGGRSAASGLTARQFASNVVGLSCIVFLTLCVSGLYLWWPRSWSWRALKSTTVFNFKLKGKARDWNWHNVIGLWSVPVLIVITFTGLIMTYRGFAGWVYPRAEGQAGFGPGAAAITVPAPAPGAALLGPDALLAAAQQAAPQWETITLRLGGAQGRGSRGSGGRGGAVGERRAPAGPPAASISVREGGLSPMATTLQLDPYTGAVLRRSGLSDLSFRQALRALNRTLHTGEAGGILGQSLAFLACCGALFLVYTGFALSFRRFFKRTPKAAQARSAPTSIADSTPVPVAAPPVSGVRSAS